MHAPFPQLWIAVNADAPAHCAPAGVVHCGDRVDCAYIHTFRVRCTLATETYTPCTRRSTPGRRTPGSRVPPHRIARVCRRVVAVWSPYSCKAVNRCRSQQSASGPDTHKARTRYTYREQDTGMLYSTAKSRQRPEPECTEGRMQPIQASGCSTGICRIHELIHDNIDTIA